MVNKRIKASEAVGPITRLSPHTAIDAEGNKITVHPNTPTEHIGFGRGYGAGNKPIYENETEFLQALQTYIYDIANNGYEKLPTKTDFARTNNISISTVFSYFNKLSTSQKKEWEMALSDTITEGVNLGKYNTTMSIFALKNWCNWADKNEQKVETSTKQLVSKQEAKDQLKKYSETLKLAK